MPHLRTDAGVDLELDVVDDGAFLLVARLELDDDLKTELARQGAPVTIGVLLTPAEARMVGIYLNPAPPAPVDGAELRARAQAAAPPRAPQYDPAKTMPASWAELIAYAKHQAGRGLEVLITVPVDVPALYDLDEHTTGGTPGVRVAVDPTTTPPGIFEVGRNGQRIARYHLGASPKP